MHSMLSSVTTDQHVTPFVVSSKTRGGSVPQTSNGANRPAVAVRRLTHS